MNNEHDFSKGKISTSIIKLALPMTIAQLINILYNVVDRMYIGRIPNAESLALTGVGVTFPIITIIMAFANLIAMGGAPLCSIARGKKDDDYAEKIMGNCFILLISLGLILTSVFLIIKRPLLYLFGASSDTFTYANNYITIYVLGSIFVMISLGMNNFINCQGYAKTGMMTILLGAIINIILDPIFIFVLGMDVKGAALATIISQFFSAFWVLHFLMSSKSKLKLKRKNFNIDLELFKKIVTLGLSGFIMSLTNSIVQIICNITLQTYGGDLYVGIMTVINSIREIILMPITGITNGAQPVISYNYGAKENTRVKSSIKFMTISCIIYSTFIWIVLELIPKTFIQLFNTDPMLLQSGIKCMNLYFFGFFMMSLQFSGQSTYVALGKSKHAIFFSLLRKVIIVVPLTILLPKLYNLGTSGVFIAEPVSNFVGGLACYTTMIFSVWKTLDNNDIKIHDRNNLKNSYAQ